MRAIKIVIIILSALFLNSCGLYWTEEWLMNWNMETDKTSELGRTFKSDEIWTYVKSTETPEREFIISRKPRRMVNYYDNSFLGYNAGYIAISNDRTKIVFIKDDDIYLANTERTEEQNLTNNGSSVVELTPSFSEDDTKIVYAVSNSNTTHSFCSIHTLELSTGEDIELFTRDVDFYLFFCNPILIDTKLYYLRGIDPQNLALYRTRLDGTNQRSFISNVSSDLQCSYSERKLLFYVHIDQMETFYILDIITDQLTSSQIRYKYMTISQSYNQGLVFISSLYGPDSVLYNLETDEIFERHNFWNPTFRLDGINVTGTFRKEFRKE